MNGIYIIYSDECTYSFDEVLFITPDETTKAVYDRLNQSYEMTEDLFLELVTEKYVSVKDKSGYTTNLKIDNIEMVE